MEVALTALSDPLVYRIRPENLTKKRSSDTGPEPRGAQIRSLEGYQANREFKFKETSAYYCNCSLQIGLSYRLGAWSLQDNTTVANMAALRIGTSTSFRSPP